MKKNQYVLNLWITKIFDGKKTFTIVNQDDRRNRFRAGKEKKDDNAITPSKMLTFFQWLSILYGYCSRCKSKNKYIKLIPTI
jgi:hypothetical protein